MADGMELSINELLAKFKEVDLSVEEAFESYETLRKKVEQDRSNIGSLNILERRLVRAVFGEEPDVITEEHLEVFAKILHSLRNSQPSNNSGTEKFPFQNEAEIGNGGLSGFSTKMEKNGTTEIGMEHNGKEFYRTLNNAIRQAISLSQKKLTIGVAALYLLPPYKDGKEAFFPKDEIINKAKEINAELDNEYSEKTIRQAVSRVINNEELTDYKRSEDGYRLIDSVRNKITKTLERLWEEQLEKKKLSGSGDILGMTEDFKMFFSSYIDGNGQRIYREKIISLITEENSRSLSVDFAHILSFMPSIAERLLEEPDDVLLAAEDAVGLVLRDEFFQENPPRIHVRFYNLPKTIEPRFVSPDHINNFIQIRGVVTRLSSIEPFVSRAVFVCRDCGNEMIRLQREYSLKLVRPVKCDECGSKNIELDAEKSRFRRYQTATIQDTPEKLKGGQLPRNLNIVLLDDLCDSIIPGDRVLLTGTLRLLEGEEDNKPVKKVVLIVNHIEKESKDEEDITVTPDEEKRILEEVKSPEYKRKLVQSFAPTVHGYENEKLGILLSLFGGHDEYSPAGERKRKRIHILLVGDPGTAKSHLLDFTAKVAPRAVRASGKGASGVGLMAAAKKDNITGRWTVDAGTLVLADNGFAIIDELDKMSREDRNSLHEPMEQGSVYFAKAGLNMVLNARATVIAAANPKFGKINKNKTLPEQIDLPPSLMSRFDLIFTFINTVDEKKDKLVAEAILKRWYEGERIKPPYSPEFLKKLIVYARKKIKTLKLDPQLKEDIQQYYSRLRKRLKNSEGFSITPRQLEAVLRLAEAHARMHLRDTVTKEDFEVAVNLLEYSLQRAAIDEEGTIDVSVIEVGRSSRRLRLKQMVLEAIERLQSSSDWGAPKEDVIEEIQQLDFKRVEIEEMLKELMESGEVYQPRGGYYKILSQD